MTAAGVSGAVCVVALWLVLRNLRPRPEPLGAALARLHQTAEVSMAAPTPARSLSWELRLGRGALQRIAVLSRAVERLRSDLRVAGRTPEQHVVRCATRGLIGLCTGPWLGLIAWSAGSSPPIPVLGTVSLIAAAIGVAGPWTELRRTAAERRRSFEWALTAWCSVASMCLAAGRGIHQAVTTAASTGKGWAFDELRAALSGGAVRGETAWASLEQLGADLGVDDLRELAATIAMAGEDGAAVRQALAAKAKTIRTRITAETERRAEAAAAEMELPALGLGIGFLIFVGYPALTAIGSGF